MRTLIVTFAGLLAVSGIGCGSTEVERAEVPPAQTAQAVPVSELPKDQQPGEGSSAGMTVDPTRGISSP